MTMPWATESVLVLSGAALLLMPETPRIGRLGRIAGSAPSGRPRRPRTWSGSTRRSGAFAVAIVAVGIALSPGLWWAVLPAGVIVGVLLSRRPVGRSAARRQDDQRLISVHAELLAACLDAGMGTGKALLAVSDVLDPSGVADPTSSGPSPSAMFGGAVAQVSPLAALDAVAAMLSLGADPAIAWRVVDSEDELAPLAAAALRSAAGGGGLAEAARDYAAQLRQDIASRSVRAAGRAGVLMTAPLGVCFLPAFLCLGLAPVVVGLLGQLQIF